MPENTIYVGRPTSFGNPFRVGYYYRECDGDPLISINTPSEAVMLFRNSLNKNRDEIYPLIKEALKGKNLACWCKVGDPCHADVLLEIANS